MRGRMLAAFAMAINAAAASASDATFDERLARAASDIVAAKMGPLRGGLAPGELRLVRSRETPSRPHAAVPPVPQKPVWDRGLAVAVEAERKASPDL